MSTLPQRIITIPRKTFAAMASLSICLMPSCAFHSFDAETGTQHIWGFGHMSMRVSPAHEGVRAVVNGTESFGFSAGNSLGQGFISLGWHRVQVLQVVDENTQLRLEWPTLNLNDVRVGTTFPDDDIMTDE